MMKRIKNGDKVVRISHREDIIFEVIKIIKNGRKRIAILKGITERIEVDSDVEDLVLADKEQIINSLKVIDNRFEKDINKHKNTKENRKIEQYITGKILHLDGDRRYSEKSFRYYQKMGLKAIVKNIPEYRQPRVVYKLLKIYRPDILIITGHDGMIKRGTNFNDIYNYRNSKHFINTVKEARRYDNENNTNTVIFAGACQSYFEAIMMAGANFASSPARILIDFLDPLIIAEKVATTENYKFVTVEDVIKEIRDGRKGIGGIGSNGKMVVM